MFLRSMFTTVACVGLLISAGSASAGSTVIDFRGNAGHKNSHTFSEDGISVTATGGAFNYSNKLITSGVKVGQWSHGLGVKNSPTDDKHTVDGNGWDDVLFLNFNTNVLLDKIFFGWTNGGKVKVWSGDLAELLGTYTLSYYGGGYYQVDLPGSGFAGNSFALEASGKKDSYKVAAVKVHDLPTTVIPSPAAGLAGMALLGLVMTARRRLA